MNIIAPEALLSDDFLSKYKNTQPDWGFNGMGYVIFKRTYARTKPDGTTEEWWETIARCIKGAQEIGADYTVAEAEELFDHIFHLRCCFSGRSLWQLGTENVQRIGMDSLLNCWVTKISDIEDFIFVITESMLGGGVGCVITKEFTHELPRVKKNVNVTYKNTKDADFIVPDSKEGWAELFRKIYDAYLVSGKSFSFSTVCIREAGSPIKTFGGVAPGPKPLVDGALEAIKILERRSGKKLRTEDVADLVCVGGEMVKSGGVRRTALVLQGDIDDAAYAQLKRWDLGTIPYYRSNSNNSFITPKFEYISDKYWKTFDGSGEVYGLINLYTSRNFGRLGESIYDGFNLRNEDIIGGNPCVEAMLEDKECCNLAELNKNKIRSKEEMARCATLLYKTQKAIAAGPYLHEVTNKVVHRNMRLGLSVTGVCQRITEHQEWCDYTYRELRKFDKEYSKLKGWPESIRLTVVQPSGTKSLLCGATPGGHPAYSRFHIRTVRFSSGDPLIPKLKDLGYRIEPEVRLDGTINRNISVVYFPCDFGEGVVEAKDMGAVNQLELVKSLQTYWADQSVSVTIYYKKEEIPAIKEWLRENYNNSIKSVSFLMHTTHNFPQPVLAEITEEAYNEMVSRLKPIENLMDTGGKELELEGCANGACPIK